MQSSRAGSRPFRWKISARKILVVFAVFVAIGVALPFGCVGNRQFNTVPGDYLRIHRTESGLPFAVAVIEFDDQGEPWDLAQLEAAMAAIRSFNESSEHGVVLYQFIHGWKSNASRDPDSGMRLAWFREQVATFAEYSAEASVLTGEQPRPVVGVFIGWRGRTYSLPVLIDASFWNRRVAAHRVASTSLVEVLQRTLQAASEDPDSKSFLLGHSMGGMILEKTVGPAMVGEVLAVTGTGEPVSMGYDLVISANPSTEALYTKRLIDVLKRTGVGLVLEDDEGIRRAAHGPMMVSITSEGDGVTRFMVPIAMTVNSVFLRFRGDAGDGLPSQRSLGIKTAGHTPALFSHEVVVRGDEIVISELPRRWNDTPLWVFRVPVEISADHGDLSSPLLGRLMRRLLDLNEVFDPELELKLAGRAPPAVVAADGAGAQ